MFKITRTDALRYHQIFQKALEALADDDAMQIPMLYKPWKPDTEYAVGERVQYGELLYKCLIAHTSQESWTPEVSPSLWVRVDNPAEEWPEWVQPLGSTDAYPMGAKVSHNEKHWISNVDANIWEPGVYGWSEEG